jgi:PAS domain-containing protein
MTETKSRPLDLSGPRPEALSAPSPPAFLADAERARVLDANAAAIRLGLAPERAVPSALAPLLRAMQRDPAHAPLARLRPPAGCSTLTFRLQSADGGVIAIALDAAAPPAPAAGPEAPPVSADPPPLRFTFEADAEGRVLGLSDALAGALGAMADRLAGATFAELEAQGLARGAAEADAALKSGASFAGARVTLAGDPPLELELGAAPVLGAGLRRGAMRGFGLARQRPRLHLPPPAPPAAAPTEAKVVPLRGTGTLSPAEHSAFREIARTLAAAVEDWPKGDDRLAPLSGDAPFLSTEPPETAPGPLLPDTFAAPVALLDRLPLALLVEQDGTAIHANLTFLKWSGHPDLSAFQAAGGLAAALERGSDGVLRLVTASGERLPVEVRLMAAPYGGRNALLYVARRIEDGAPAAEARAEALSRARREALDLVPWPVLLLEEDGLVMFANRAALRLLERSERQSVGTPFLSLVAAADREAAAEALSAALAAEPVACAPLDLTLRAGAAEGAPVRAALARGGQDDRLVCVVLAPRPPRTAAPDADSDGAAVEAPPPELPATPPPAPDLGPARLAALARLMRARLAPVLETLLPADAATREAPAVGLDGRTRAALATLRSELDDLGGLAEPEPPPPLMCDLAALAREVLAFLEPAARRRGVRLRADLPAMAPVAADAPRLARLLRLLLEDALAASPDDASIAVAILPMPHDSDAVAIEIADAGPPMDEVAIARALDPIAPSSADADADAPAYAPLPRPAAGPLRFARLAFAAEALGGALTLRRGLSSGMVARLRLPRTPRA